MGESDSFIQSRVPWSSEPILKEMAGEVGVDVDSFIEGIKNDKIDGEIAEDLGVSENLIYHLRDRL
ncbi:MAG: helix-turn-helix domain-containing protein [Desulfotomaculaceae bacterium]|nr:helix-turn-helix domain-containing protein [Desulfotomaculaceae bacterium]